MTSKAIIILTSTQLNLLKEKKKGEEKKKGAEEIPKQGPSNSPQFVNSGMLFLRCISRLPSIIPDIRTDSEKNWYLFHYSSGFFFLSLFLVFHAPNMS